MLLRLNHFVIISAVLFSFDNLYAEEASTFKIHHHYLSTKSAGMGDASVASVNDYSAIYYNPAALARREDGQMNFALNFAGTPTIQKFTKDVSDAANVQGSDTDKATAVADVLESTYGKNFGVRLGLLESAWVRPGWGIGFLPADISMDLSVHRQVGPAVNVRFVGDTTLAYAYAQDVNWISNGRLSAGITGKFVNRVFIDRSLNFLDLAINPNFVQKSDLREGYTVDADLGFLWTPELPDEGILSALAYAQPSFGMVIRNVAELGFKRSFKLVNKETSNDPPEKLYRVIDFGTKWEYPSFWIFGGRGTLDFRDLLHPAASWRKSLHLGFEFDWTMYSWWKGNYRIGLNQMYLTAGLSMYFGVFNLDIATYAEDIGTANTPKENRIYMAKFNIDF